MKQTMLLKLAPTTEQHAALLETIHRFNAGANYVADVAFAERLAHKHELQKLVYGELRTVYHLSAQLAIRCISKVTDVYKRDKSIKSSFCPEGAIVYDPRIMSFKERSTVSLLTINGRVLIPFRIGAYQQARLGNIKGQADLIYRNGVFYLAVTLDLSAPPLAETNGVVGVDLGIINLATTSDGETFSGEAVERNRKRHLALRQLLQKRGTTSAKRHLKRLSGREKRFKKNTNHVISKRIVHKAKAARKAIAIEDLRHIRQRTERTVKRSQRNRHSSWAFAQLRFFLEYKARADGVMLYTVDPRNTSHICSQCGHCTKSNRQSQSSFRCQSCGYAAPADVNASVNISRAAVKRLIVGGRAH